MQFFLAAIISLVLGMSAALAAPMSPERMQYLMEWAGQATGYKTHKVELPPVIYLTHEQLQVSFYGDKYYEYQKYENIRLAEVRATYDHDAQIMFLNSTVDYTVPDNEVIVLHELVHHLQAVNEYRPACMRQTEEEAYKVQSLWAKATGHGEVPNPIVVMMVSTCHHES